jgi:arabinogalactan oligomer/maltooligosaccharide transport system permease protein
MVARWLLRGLALAMLMGIAWPSPARAEAPIRLWHTYRGAEEAALMQIVAEFEGPPVVVLALPYDAFAAKLSAAIPHGEGPDLYIDSHERLGDYRRRQIVAEVGDAIEADAFEPFVLAAVTQDGEAWAVPLNQKSLALYVNTDLVQTVPTDLESIVALAPSLPPGVFALAYDAMNPYVHAPILHAFGGRMLTEDDQFGFVGPEAEASLLFVSDLLNSGAVPRDADGALVTSLFISGKAAFALTGPWLAAELGDAVPYRVVVLPNIAATGRLMRPFLTVEAMMLSPRGAKRLEVRTLARHVASARAARIRQDMAQTLSARSDVDPSGDPFLQAFADQAKRAVPMPATPAMRSTWVPAQQAIRKVLRGDTDPKSALEQAEHRFRDVRRPPPPPAEPWPGILVVSALCLWGAVLLVHRARGGNLRANIRASLPAYRYVAHAVIAVGILVILPLAVGAVTALFAGPAGEIRYVGLANFVDILTARGGPLLASGSFYLVLLVTVAWTLVNVVFHLAIGVTLGLLLAQPLRMRGLYRVLLIIPWAVPNYVTALAWKGMFHRQFGAITGVIRAINETLGTDIETISWFAHFSTAFTANVATNVWLGFPFMMVVTLGALTAVPKDVLEAAEVDGATRWQRLWRITLPMIRPSMMPAITLGAIWTFNMFNVVFLVSGGEPDGTTDILVSEAYRWAFTREAQYGYAAAYAVLIFVLLMGGTRLLEQWKHNWSGSGRGGAR